MLEDNDNDEKKINNQQPANHTKYQIDKKYLDEVLEICLKKLNNNNDNDIDNDDEKPNDDSDKIWRVGHHQERKTLLSVIAEKELLLSNLQMEIMIADYPVQGTIRISPRKRRLTEVKQMSPRDLFEFAKDLVESVEVIKI
jgi:flagellar motor switch/type III secretory pathway protein FliN